MSPPSDPPESHPGPRVAAVVVAWNSRADLPAALRSLLSARPPVEIAVVDNASEDGTAALVRQEFPSVRVIEAGAEEDLISFNHSLRTLVEHDLVELEVALAASDRPEELLLGLRGFTKGTQAQKRGPLRLQNSAKPGGE